LLNRNQILGILCCNIFPLPSIKKHFKKLNYVFEYGGPTNTFKNKDRSIRVMNGWKYDTLIYKAD
jgi:hypothetical protein